MQAAAKQEESSRRAEARRGQIQLNEDEGEESAEELRKLRLKDDWRDTHTRGAGNRRNIS